MYILEPHTNLTCLFRISLAEFFLILLPELILYDKAASVGPRMWSNPVCLVCLKKIDNNPTLCSKCSWPVCDEKCADSHAKMLECEVFANSTNKVKKYC